MLFLRKRKPRFEIVALEVLRLRQLKADATARASRHEIPRLIRYFGKFPIDKVTESIWNDYVLREREKKDRKFFDDRKYMRIVLNYAHRNGLVEKKAHLPIPDAPWNAGREILTKELELLEATAGRTLRFQIRIGWKMGLRLREMLRLRWDQFNWDRATISFLPMDTKTRRGREIPIPGDLVPEFSSRRALAGSPFVFPSPGGPGKPQGNNKTAWRRCKGQANVRARWHDLRHTCATLLLRRGVPRHVARVYLGMSEAILTRIYTHLNTDDLRTAANVMSEKKIG